MGLAQFLLEAVVLSVVGGLAGIVLGVGASEIIARYAGWPVAPFKVAGLAKLAVRLRLNST